jgi:UPF0755 protein
MKNIFKKHQSQLWIFIWVLSYFCIFFNIYYFFNNIDSKYFKPIIKEKKYFYIYPNTNYNILLQNLKDSFDIPDNIFFETYANKKNLSRYKAGKYEFDSLSSLNDIINIIRIPANRKGVWFTFNAFDDFGMISSKFINTFPIGKDSTFTNFPNSIDSIDVINTIYSYDYSDYIDCSIDSNLVKALFIPDSYKFYWHSSIEEFIGQVLDKYHQYWNEKRLIKANNINLTPVEVSIIASIAYKEALHEFEYDTIAGLYLNRLNQGIKLQADPTVNYAFQEKNGFDKSLNRVYDKHTVIESKYNTYIYQGLPPAPICIPSKQSIEAVLRGINHNYLYMCAQVEIDEVNKHILFNKTHLFEEKYKDHHKNAKEYQSALNKIEKDNLREKKGKDRRYKVCYNHYYHQGIECLNNNFLKIIK